VEGDGRAEARGGRKRRGRILLVDEATASLDAATDAAVQSTIKSSIEFAGVTTHSS
jgi:ABC-type multidrug transport system fused ATPase/permease subunit